MAEFSSFKLSYEIPANYSLILAAVSIVVNVYAPATRSPVLIGRYATTRTGEQEHNDIIDAFLTRASAQVTIRFLIESHKTVSDIAQKILGFGKDLSDEEYFFKLYHKKDKAIWFVDSLKSFKQLKADILNKRLHYDRSGFFCIIYTGRESKRLSIVRKLFQQLFAIFVINVNILITYNEMVYVYTYFPYSMHKCGDTTPLLYDKLGPRTNYSFRQTKFFSKKLLNMFGCKIRITSWDEPPFIMVRYNERTGEFLRLDGIEGKLITLLAERMNFTIQFINEPNHDRGKIMPNGTATGTAKMLIDGETDIFIVCLKYDKARGEYGTPAYTYLNVPLNVAIAKGQLMTPFERLYRPFEYIVWSCLTSSVLFGIFAILILKSLANNSIQRFIFGHSNRIPLTNFLQAICGISISSPLPRRNFARYLFGIWILYTWILRTAYTGQLFTILQDSRGRTTLSKIDEIVKRNFTFYTFPLLVPSLEGFSLAKLNIEFVDNDKNSLPNLFERLGHDENSNLAVTVVGHIIRSYNQNQKDYRRRINILPEPLFDTPLTFYMQKDSFLAYEINEIILNIMSAGLIRRFEELYLNKDSVSKKQQPALISLWLLLGLFTLYISFLLLSTLVFLFELWSKHSPLTRRIMDFLNL